MQKKVIIIGGGTVSHVRSHLSLAAVSYGSTAKLLHSFACQQFENMDNQLVLTKMADSNSSIETVEQLSAYVDTLIIDNTVKVIFFTAAVCDFNGSIDDVPSGKYSTRLETRSATVGAIQLTATEKIINKIRKHRKDIFLVAFKTTCNDEIDIQFAKGLLMLKQNSANLVLANDVGTRNNVIITPEEGVYKNFIDRNQCLWELVRMAYYRSHLSFTRSTVVDGQPIAWSSSMIPISLRNTIDWCIKQGAYKTFNGVTTGHFAVKLSTNEFLTSIRKTNFNDIEKNGMVMVRTDGEDQVIAYGMKPSVGGQSQRIVFNTFPDVDCIVHFHCPLKEKPESDIPVVSQFEYECGSHQCGQNTANGLKKFGDIYAVMLDNHGPNIVFNSKLDSQSVIDFISNNFDLTKSSSGFEKVYLPLMP